jgi:hypothetical protein
MTILNGHTLSVHLHVVDAAYAGPLRFERPARKASKARQLRVARLGSRATNRKDTEREQYQAAHRSNEKEISHGRVSWQTH